MRSTTFLPLILLSLFCQKVQSTENIKIDAVIFAAGQGTRFDGENKLLAPIHGQPIVSHPVSAAAELNLPMILVVGHQEELVKKAAQAAAPNSCISFVKQREQLGTGHALQCTRDQWKGDDVLVMNGDHPLTNSSLLSGFIEQHKLAQADISVLVTRPTKPCRWGRFVQDEQGTRIVEAIDFKGNPEEHPYLNAGYYIFSRAFLEKHIDELWIHENKGEYYVTDLIEIAGRHGIRANAVQAPFHKVFGVNNREEFAYAEQLMNYPEAQTQTVVLAAGKSSRYKGERSKLLTPICGQPIVSYSVQAASELNLPVTVVTGHQGEDIRSMLGESFANHALTFALQDQLIGTGYAIRCCLDKLWAEDILVLYGDHPTTDAHTLKNFIKSHQKADATVSIIVCERPEPGSYGRIITTDGITRCVEAKDFHDDPKDYPLVNAGYYLIKRDFLIKHIDDLWLHENKNEYYVNDYIEIASRMGHKIHTYTVPYDSVRGVNTTEEYAIAEEILKKRHSS